MAWTMAAALRATFQKRTSSSCPVKLLKGSCDWSVAPRRSRSPLPMSSGVAPPPLMVPGTVTPST